MRGRAGLRLVRRSTASRRRRTTSARPRDSRRPIAPSTGWPPIAGCPARPRSSATPSSTSRPRARSTSRSCARTWRRGPSRSTRSCGSTPWRSRRPISPRRPGTSGGCSTRSARNGAWTGCAPTCRSSAASRPALTAGGYRVTVAVHGGRDVIAVWPGFHDRAFGVAIDVGSTTIAGHLVEPDRRRPSLPAPA